MNTKEIDLRLVERLMELSNLLVSWIVGTTFFYVIWKILKWIAIMVVASGVLFADYTQNRWVGNLTNPLPTVQRKRVSMFDAETTPTSTQYYVAPESYSRSANGGTTSYQIRLVVRESGVWSWGTSSITVPGVSPGYSSMEGTTPEVVLSGAPDGAIWQVKYDWQAWEYPSFWNGSLGQQIRNVNPGGGVPVLTRSVGGTTVRGALLHQYEFEMAPHSSMSLNLEHTGPFYVVVEDYKQFLTNDGATTYGYEEVDEHTSTLATIVDPSTVAPPPENIVDAPNVEYTAGETAPPAAKPKHKAGNAETEESDDDERVT